MLGFLNSSKYLNQKPLEWGETPHTPPLTLSVLFLEEDLFLILCGLIQSTNIA